jgi:hypothetical protein
VSFVFILEVDDLGEEQAQMIERLCGENAWPVLLHRRRRFFGLLRGGEVELYVPDALGDQHILTDDAMWDADAWEMEPSLLPLLADTIRILGEAVPQGFSFRATWVGDEVREDVELNAEALAGLALASRLNEFTRYRVPAAPSALR